MESDEYKECELFDRFFQIIDKVLCWQIYQNKLQRFVKDKLLCFKLKLKYFAPGTGVQPKYYTIMYKIYKLLWNYLELFRTNFDILLSQPVRTIFTNV